MQVKNVEYFHIHRIGQHSSLWSVGSRINWVQKKNNLFYDHYNQNGHYYNDGTDPLPFNQALNRFLKNDKTYQNKEAINIITASQEVTKSLTMFIREQIFEEVRTNYFPHLPCRKTCIWVCTREAVKFWWDTLKSKNQKILKLNLTGSLYLADQKHLLADTYRHDDLRAKAFEYWTGCDGIILNDQEVLFEGIIDVKEEYQSLEALKNA